jgi:hypothetical protein
VSSQPDVTGQARFDTQFSLPAIDDSPMTETGVILMGLDAERLLTGLGMAAPADDPAQLALAVDQVRHGATEHESVDALLAAGVLRWRAACRTLDAAGWRPSRSGSLREAWNGTLHALAGADIGAAGPAARAYLAACWLRREAVDRCAAERPTA